MFDGFGYDKGWAEGGGGMNGVNTLNMGALGPDSDTAECGL